MKFSRAALVLLALAFPVGVEAGTEQEVAHLLEYLEQSECVFVRNGKEYDGAEALGHIGKKYDYVKKRVKTAEDFIEYAATRSSLSGKPYLVRCDGEELLTAQWLKTELARLRQPPEGTGPH